MHHVKAAVTTLLALALLAAANAGAETRDTRMRVGSGAVERDSWTGPTAGLPVRVVNHHGDIRLRHSDQAEALEAAAMLQQIDVDGSKLILDVSVVDDTVVVSIVRRNADGSQMAKPPRGQLSRGDIAVLVPAGAPVHAETTFGLIETRNVQADLDLETFNGNISVVGAAGPVTARSNLGAVEVNLAAGAPAKPQRLTTETGAITVFAPPGAGLDVTMTTSGSFVTDYSLTVEHRAGQDPDKVATATVGGGGVPVVMTSARGDVGLRRPIGRH